MSVSECPVLQRGASMMPPCERPFVERAAHVEAFPARHAVAVAGNGPGAVAPRGEKSARRAEVHAVLSASRQPFYHVGEETCSARGWGGPVSCGWRLACVHSPAFQLPRRSEGFSVWPTACP